MTRAFFVIVLLLGNLGPAYADRIGSDNEILSIAETIRTSSCAINCQVDGFRFEEVTLPSDIFVGNRWVFSVEFVSTNCGNAGCPTVLIAIGPTDVHFLAGGLGRVSPQSPSVQSVSEATLVGGTLMSGVVNSQISPDVATAGGLCTEARTSTLSSDDIQGLFWRSRVEGSDLQGRKWIQYFSPANEVIFTDFQGVSHAGYYKIEGNMLCSSFEDSGKWDCRRISRCLSGEADYVILDLEANQTSLFSQAGVEPFGFMKAFPRVWEELVSRAQPRRPETTPVGNQETTTLADTSDASSEANLMFVDATALYRDALAKTSPDREVKLAEVGHILAQLAELYPESLAGRAILAGTSLGVIDRKLVGFETANEGLSDLDTDQVGTPAATTTNSVAEAGERPLPSTRTSSNASLGTSRISAALTFGTQSVEIDGANCLLRVSHRTTIEEKVRSSGGWAEFLGGSSDGTEKVGEMLASTEVDLRKAGAWGSNQATNEYWLRPREGAVFPSQWSTKRTDDPSRNSIQRSTVEVAVIQLPASRGRETSELLDDLLLHCAFPGASEPVDAIDGADVQIVRLVSTHRKLTARATTVDFVDGGFDAAVYQGLTARVVQHATNGITNHGSSWEAAVTTRGHQRGIASASPTSFELSEPQAIGVAITDKRNISSGRDSIMVEFSWTYEQPSLIVQRFGVKGGTGKAILSNWEEGWRIDSLDISVGRVGFTISEEIQAAEDADIVATRNEGGPWVYASDQRQFIQIASPPLLTSSERNERNSLLDSTERRSVLDLLTGNKEYRGDDWRFAYLLEGTWFEFAQGTSKIGFFVDSLDPVSGRIRAGIAPISSMVSPLGRMRFLTTELGYLEGRIDLSSFTMELDYYRAAGTHANLAPSGSPIVSGIRLFPRFDSTGQVTQWYSGGDDFGGITGSLTITNNKIAP